MSAMASQITGVSIACSTSCRRRSKKTTKFRVNGLDEGNPPVTSGFPHKGPITRQMFLFDDVIMLITKRTLRVSRCICKFLYAFVIHVSMIRLTRRFDRIHPNGRVSLSTTPFLVWLLCCWWCSSYGTVPNPVSQQEQTLRDNLCLDIAMDQTTHLDK